MDTIKMRTCSFLLPDPGGEVLREALDEVERLQAWKDSALALAATWDAQAVGRELGVGLGESIYDKILPGIKAIRAENEQLTKIINDRGACMCGFLRVECKSHAAIRKERDEAQADAARWRKRVENHSCGF